MFKYANDNNSLQESLPHIRRRPPLPQPSSPPQQHHHNRIISSPASEPKTKTSSVLVLASTSSSGMVLPSTGEGLEFEADRQRHEQRPGSYFALRTQGGFSSSGWSSPDSDDGLGSSTDFHTDRPRSFFSPFFGRDRHQQASLEHGAAPDNTWAAILYYYWHKPCLTRRRLIIGGSLIATLLLLTIWLTNSSSDDIELVPPDPEVQPPQSWSKLRTFKRGAVCADGPPCALIGKLMLERKGSAVDAAIAALICNGLANMQSMGFGGGFMMTIYDSQAKRAVILNARDAAPAAAHSHMFKGLPKSTSQVGGLAIGVPGELAGYWEAHQRYGKLPWADLFQPSIDLCEKGYNLSKVQHEGLFHNSTKIHEDPTLREIFVDPDSGEFHKPGSVIRPLKLCKTMRIIAEKNATEFYNGTIGQMLVEDIRKRGSIITMQDLNNYRAKWEEPETTQLYNGLNVYSAGVPGSGGLLLFILNVLDEFNFTSNALSSINSTVLTYHRLIEVFKYAFGLRSHMGDSELPKFSKNLTSKPYARSVHSQVNDSRTWTEPTHYGANFAEVSEDHGTAHISVISENGDAVSVTSTINIYFGSGVVSERTGVLLNDAMDDFSLPGAPNYFGLPPTESNYINPGKRPLTSMSPTIFTDHSGNVTLVIGAAGGTKIPTSLSYVIARHLWMGNTIKQAVDAPRIHHQLMPMEVSYEFGVPKPVINGLRALGHKTSRYRERGSVVCILAKKNDTILANADYRKGGDVYGID